MAEGDRTVYDLLVAGANAGKVLTYLPWAKVVVRGIPPDSDQEVLRTCGTGCWVTDRQSPLVVVAYQGVLTALCPSCLRLLGSPMGYRALENGRITATLWPETRKALVVAGRDDLVAQYPE